MLNYCFLDLADVINEKCKRKDGFCFEKQVYYHSGPTWGIKVLWSDCKTFLLSVYLQILFKVYFCSCYCLVNYMWEMETFMQICFEIFL